MRTRDDLRPAQQRAGEALTRAEICCPNCHDFFDFWHKGEFLISEHTEITCPLCGQVSYIIHECCTDICVEYLEKVYDADS